jgi:hypothetical protein
LEELFLNVATLTGPLPDLSRLTSLNLCSFIPSQLCRIPDFVPVNSQCDFSVLPVCKDLIPDCVILADWLPKLFDEYSCCQVDGVACEEDRIVILNVSKAKTVTFLYGDIPTKIGDLEKLVDITNNYLSGVLPFFPTFDLIGI